MKEIAGTRPMPQVICGFPGIGKSTMFKNKGDAKILDSDSSTFDKSEFPANYIKHIQEKTAEGYTILASSHDTVRKALVEAGIPFVLVYPRLECRDEYLRRYQKRGSPQAFIDLLADNFNKWIDGCLQQKRCAHYVLRSGEYLPSLDRIQARINDPEYKAWR